MVTSATTAAHAVPDAAAQAVADADAQAEQDGPAKLLPDSAVQAGPDAAAQPAPSADDEALPTTAKAVSHQATANTAEAWCFGPHGALHLAGPVWDRFESALLQQPPQLTAFMHVVRQLDSQQLATQVLNGIQAEVRISQCSLETMLNALHCSPILPLAMPVYHVTCYFTQP